MIVFELDNFRLKGDVEETKHYKFFRMFSYSTFYMNYEIQFNIKEGELFLNDIINIGVAGVNFIVKKDR